MGSTKRVQCVSTRQRYTTASEIVASFNTWAFKREQPDNLNLLIDCAERARLANEPLEFVTYWGKGPRPHVAAPDIRCLDFLLKMQNRIEEVYDHKAKIHLLLTDTHAALNQHAAESIDSYYSAIAEEARARSFHSRLLSDVVKAANVPMPAHQTPPSSALLSALKESASKWYLGERDCEDVALEYYFANMREKKSVEREYPYAIFITFNNSNFRPLFPDAMPVFYMYSLKRGVAVKPWFIASEDQTATQARTVSAGHLQLAG